MGSHSSPRFTRSGDVRVQANVSHRAEMAANLCPVCLLEGTVKIIATGVGISFGTCRRLSPTGVITRLAGLLASISITEVDPGSQTPS